MFCVSKQVVTLAPGEDEKLTRQLYVYRFRRGNSVEISHGNPPTTKTVALSCVGNRTFTGFMVFSFSGDWQKGVATFLDPVLTTVEFLNCAPDA
jgi:hypothetical protein